MINKFKKVFFLIFIISLALIPTSCFSSSKALFLVDSFEDGNININPEWFQFGDAIFSVQENTPNSFTKEIKEDGVIITLIRNFKKCIFLNPYTKKDQATLNEIGKYALDINGAAKSWYCGGIGTYMGIDLKPYNFISLYIKGYGPKSGRLKIELFDDDCGKWTIQNNLYYDRFYHEIAITWRGWQKIDIPFKAFKIDSTSTGDKKWNPYQTNGSGGLLQIQFIALSAQSEKQGKVHFKIDDIYFSQ